jgi:hypothetical protein
VYRLIIIFLSLTLVNPLSSRQAGAFDPAESSHLVASLHMQPMITASGGELHLLHRTNRLPSNWRAAPSVIQNNKPTTASKGTSRRGQIPSPRNAEISI